MNNVFLDRWIIAPNATWTSGFAINVVQGTDLNGDSADNDRPLFRVFQEVKRVSRMFRFRERYGIAIIAEVEKLISSLNPACTAAGYTAAVVNTYSEPDFRRITSANDSRQVQHGGRVRC